MTFSIIGHCARTGQFGAATATSSLAVGSRCLFARAGVGAVLSQYRTDPRLGPRGLDLLASGCTAQEALDALVASTIHREWRQLAIMDSRLRTAVFSGRLVKPELGQAEAENCVVIGNILANMLVLPAMAEAFAAEPGAHLGERLVAALAAGLEAGGEPAPLRSAALLVVAEEQFPLIDLRVDLAAHPVAALSNLWREYSGWMDEFVIRALDPDRATGAAR
jgi:uncharacterized Ntn-hydrolase superfamily protein